MSITNYSNSIEEQLYTLRSDYNGYKKILYAYIKLQDDIKIMIGMIQTYESDQASNVDNPEININTIRLYVERQLKEINKFETSINSIKYYFNAELYDLLRELQENKEMKAIDIKRMLNFIISLFPEREKQLILELENLENSELSKQSK